MILAFFSAFLFSCTSHVNKFDVCNAAQMDVTELKTDYFLGQWYSYEYSEVDLSTTTESCYFKLNGIYSCQITEHGPMNKDNTLFHADSYVENGKWRFENNRFHKNGVNWTVHLSHVLKSASEQSFTIIINSEVNQTFYKNEACAKTS